MLKNFQSRLAFFFLLLFVAVFASTLFSVYKLTQNNVLQQIERKLNYASELFQQEIEDLGEDFMALAQKWTDQQEFAKSLNLTAAQLNPVLEPFAKQLKIDYLMVLDANQHPLGQYRAPTLPPMTPAFWQDSLNETGAPGYRLKVYQEEVVLVGQLQITEGSMQTTWLFSKAISGLFLETLKKISELNIGLQFAYHPSLGSDSWQLTSPIPTGFNSVSLSDSPIHLNQSHYVKKHDEVILVIPFDHFAAYPLVALLNHSFKQALTPYHPIFYAFIGFGLIGGLLFICGTLMISTRLSRPIQNLSDGMTRVLQGDLTTPLNVLNEDQLGQLTHTFNHMVQILSQREQKITYQAQYNLTTQLPNRKTFEDRITQQLEAQSTTDLRAEVILIGLTKFLHIHHKLGHHIGDQLRAKVANALQSALKPHLVASIGPHVFGVFLCPSDTPSLNALLGTVQHMFEEPFHIAQVNIDLHIHIGTSRYPQDTQVADALIQKADRALYLATQSKKRVCHYGEMSWDPRPLHLSLMGELRHGLTNNEFEVLFQPKCCVTTEKVIGFEALIRWHHPRLGTLNPVQFIPHAEDTGYINRLTFWVIEHVIQKAIELRHQGFVLEMSVNLSVRDLYHPDFYQALKKLLTHYPIDPKCLIFEITESVLMENPEPILEILAPLRGLGIQFSLDDFGTGYSSLILLKQLPLSELKVDKSFVLNCDAQHSDKMIVRSTIELGHNLGLKVTAEGVQTPQVVDILKRYGCDLIQGYYISPPLPFEELLKWLNTL